MEKRDWKSDAIGRARGEGEQLEQLMQSILRMFADGCLTYRRREDRIGSVSTKSDRLRRVRQAIVRVGSFDGETARVAS
jgi:hypothetical protein